MNTGPVRMNLYVSADTVTALDCRYSWIVRLMISVLRMENTTASRCWISSMLHLRKSWWVIMQCLQSQVLLHSADEFPNVADRGFVIGPGSVTYAGVKAVTSFHTDLVSDQIPKAKRHCVLSDEHKLDFFGSYSASACVIECATKIMVEKCKCRAYFFRGTIRFAPSLHLSDGGLFVLAREEDTLCELDAFACISNVYGNVISCLFISNLYSIRILYYTFFLFVYCRMGCRTARFVMPLSAHLFQHMVQSWNIACAFSWPRIFLQFHLRTTNLQRTN